MLGKRTEQVVIPENAVVLLIGTANEHGPHVDFFVDEDWWKANSNQRRRAMFMALANVLEEVGKKVIPEDFPDTLHA